MYFARLREAYQHKNSKLKIKTLYELKRIASTRLENSFTGFKMSKYYRKTKKIMKYSEIVHEVLKRVGLS